MDAMKTSDGPVNSARFKALLMLPPLTRKALPMRSLGPLGMQQQAGGIRGIKRPLVAPAAFPPAKRPVLQITRPLLPVQHLAATRFGGMAAMRPRPGQPSAMWGAIPQVGRVGPSSFATGRPAALNAAAARFLNTRAPGLVTGPVRPQVRGSLGAVRPRPSTAAVRPQAGRQSIVSTLLAKSR